MPVKEVVNPFTGTTARIEFEKEPTGEDIDFAFEKITGEKMGAPLGEAEKNSLLQDNGQGAIEVLDETFKKNKPKKEKTRFSSSIESIEKAQQKAAKLREKQKQLDQSFLSRASESVFNFLDKEPEGITRFVPLAGAGGRATQVFKENLEFGDILAGAEEPDASLPRKIAGKAVGVPLGAIGAATLFAPPLNPVMETAQLLSRDFRASRELEKAIADGTFEDGKTAKELVDFVFTARPNETIQGFTPEVESQKIKEVFNKVGIEPNETFVNTLGEFQAMFRNDPVGSALIVTGAMKGVSSLKQARSIRIKQKQLGQIKEHFQTTPEAPLPEKLQPLFNEVVKRAEVPKSESRSIEGKRANVKEEQGKLVVESELIESERIKGELEVLSDPAKRAELGIADKESTSRIQRILESLNDEQLVRVLRPENEARILKNQMPLEKLPDGKTDIAAVEFTKRIALDAADQAFEIFSIPEGDIVLRGGIPFDKVKAQRVKQRIEKTTGVKQSKQTPIQARTKQLSQALKGREQEAGRVERIKSASEVQKQQLQKKIAGARIGEERRVQAERSLGRQKLSDLREQTRQQLREKIEIQKQNVAVTASQALSKQAREQIRVLEQTRRRAIEARNASAVKQLDNLIADLKTRESRAFRQRATEQPKTQKRLESTQEKLQSLKQKNITESRKRGFEKAEFTLADKIAQKREQALFRQRKQEAVIRERLKQKDIAREKLTKAKETIRSQKRTQQTMGRALGKAMSARDRGQMAIAKIRTNLRGFEFQERPSKLQEQGQSLEKRVVSEQLDQVRLDAINFVDEALPASEAKGFRNALFRANTPRQVINLIKRSTDRVEDIARREFSREYRKELKRTQVSNVAVEYRELAKALDASLTFKKIRNNKGNLTRYGQRLQKRMEFLERMRSQNKNIILPQEVLNEMALLDVKEIRNMKLSELETVMDNLDLMNRLGRTKQISRTRFSEMLQEQVLNEIARDPNVFKLSSVPLEPIAMGKDAKPTAAAQLSALVRRAQVAAREFDLAISPMEVVFDVFDGTQNYQGPIYKNFYMRARRAYNAKNIAIDAIESDFVELTNRLDLKTENFNRIGVWAQLQQEGGRNKINQLIERGRINQQDVLNLQNKGLTAGERQFYDFARKWLDTLRPQIERVMRDVHNQPLEFVDKYFPMRTDFDFLSSLEIADRMIISENPFKFLEDTPTGQRFRVRKGFTETRKVNAKQLIDVRADRVFIEHIRDALHLIHMEEALNTLGKVARSDKFKELVGDRGQVIVNDWIDTVARDGGSANAKYWHPLDRMRNNIGAGTLGFKLTSMLVQTTALFDGSVKIGPHRAVRGAIENLSPETRQFAKRAFPEVERRSGGDPTVGDIKRRGEFSTGFDIKKIGRISMEPLIFLDKETARSIALGAYRQFLESKGRKFDINKIDPEAAEYAQRTVRRTQSSGTPLDTPQAVVFGKSIPFIEGQASIARAIFQFQGFLLNRWSLIRHDLLRMGIKERSPNKIIAGLSTIFLAGYFETLIRHGLLEAKRSAFDTDDRSRRTFLRKYWENMMDNIPFSSFFYDAAVYQSSPAPVLDVAADIIRGGGGVIVRKEPESKQRAAVEGLSALGRARGLPTVQAEELLVEGIEKNRQERKSKEKAVKEILK